jgi:hypothetical protein
MSEKLLREFRDRAETLVPVPEFDVLQRNGLLRRRIRVAVAVAAASVALVAASTVAVTLDDDVIGPAHVNPTPSPTSPSPRPTVRLTKSPGVEMQYVGPGPVFLQPFDAARVPTALKDLRATFVIPGLAWYVYGDQGVGKGDPPGRGPEGAPYIRVEVTSITGVHEQRCQGAAPAPVKAVSGSSLTVARTLVDSPGIKVLDHPRTVQEFGRTAVHVQFRMAERCPAGKRFLMWRAFERKGDVYLEEGEANSFPRLTDHIVDAWVVTLRGAHVVVLASHTTDARETDLTELDRLLDSMTFDFTK